MRAIADPPIEEADAPNETVASEPKRPKTAVALRYDKDIDSAPVVLATGRGFTAEKIVETALQHGIPLRNDPGLASVLANLDLGEAIPPDLYRAVAEVLTWVYQVEKRTRRK